MPDNSPYESTSLSVRSRIYRILYDEPEGFCSKQTLARLCGVSMPTLYQNLNPLMEEGLVRYSGEGVSTGGRKAQGLEIVPDARISVGISVTEHHLRLIAADLRLKELAFRAVPFDFVSSLTREESASEVLEAFLDDFSLDRKRLLGVGMTIPGLLSEDRSRILFAPTLGLRGVEIGKLTQHIPYPVHVDNDGSASGHAECFVRGGRQNMAYLSLENGIGGAVLMKGRLYEGSRAHSGEFGHLCIEPGGLRCTCGKYGCLEPYCSPRRIAETFGVSLETFFAGVEAHRPEYEQLLYDMLRHLAIGISAIHMVLDCDVVLGGYFSEYLQPYLPVLKQYVLAGNAFEENADFVQLSRLRHNITPLGAALCFIREFVNRV